MIQQGTIPPPASTPRRARHRRSTRLFLIGLVILLLAGIAGVGALIEVGGYCGSSFLPLEDRVTAAPYVQNISSEAATIMWRTTEPTEGRVTFGAGGTLDGVAASERRTVHEVRLTGLQPDTVYAYHVHSGETTYDAATFRTAPGPDGEVAAVVVGDTGTGSDAQFEVAELLMTMEAELLLHTGDVVYRRGAACHYEERFYHPYETLIASVPVYPVLGNHDLLTRNGDPWLTAFSLPDESSGTERYYSFDFGPLHVVALDSELYYGDDVISVAQQKAWLRRDLASSDRPWTVVVIHRPPYSASPYHGGDRRILDDLVTIFAAGGVDIVFAGHEHVYERLVPIDGITYVVTGGGGGDLRSAGQGELTAVSELRHHALLVEASPDRMQVEAIDINGRVFDRIELTNPSG